MKCPKGPSSTYNFISSSAENELGEHEAQFGKIPHLFFFFLSSLPT